MGPIGGTLLAGLLLTAAAGGRGAPPQPQSELLQRVQQIQDKFRGAPTVRRRVTPSSAQGSGDRATIQAAMDARDGLAPRTVVEVVLVAGNYTTDGPLLIPSYTILRAELVGTVTIVVLDPGAGALAQKPGLYGELDGALTNVQVLGLSFDLLTFGMDPYDPRYVACCPAVRRLLHGRNVGKACPPVGNCTQPHLSASTPANSPVFFHARRAVNRNVLFGNVSTHGGVYLPGVYPDACGRHMNGIFNWAFGPSRNLAIVDCHIDRAGRDSLNIAGASEIVTLGNVSVSNSQDDGISIHASNIMWYHMVNVTGQPIQSGDVTTFNETGQMRDVLVTRCHVWNGAARGIDVIGSVVGLNISANKIGPTARAGILLDTTAASAADKRSHVQSGVINQNEFVAVGQFTNGLLNKCALGKYDDVHRLGNGSSRVVVGR